MTSRKRGVFPTDQREGAETEAIAVRSFLPLAMFLFVIGAWAIVRSPLFVDKQAEIVGMSALRAEDVLRVAGLDGPVHLLSVKPAEVERRVAVNPWVKSVHARRLWPNRLVVDVVERTPVARIMLGGVAFPVDGNGVLLPPLDGDGDGDGGHGPRLPLITGVAVKEAEVGRPLFDRTDTDVAAAVAVAGRLGPSLRMQASEIRVERGPLVVLHMRGDWKVNVGNADDLELKLQVLAVVERHARSQGFHLTSIDVRTPLQPVVGTQSAQAR